MGPHQPDALCAQGANDGVDIQPPPVQLTRHLSAHWYAWFVWVGFQVVRAVPKYREAAKIEIDILTRIAQKDPTNR